MGEVELQRRRGNLKGSENLLKLEMKQAELDIDRMNDLASELGF